jgi:hypothetical protein
MVHQPFRALTVKMTRFHTGANTNRYSSSDIRYT